MSKSRTRIDAALVIQDNGVAMIEVYGTGRTVTWGIPQNTATAIEQLRPRLNPEATK